MPTITPLSTTISGDTLAPKILVLTHHAHRATDMLMIERRCGKAIKVACHSVSEAMGKFDDVVSHPKEINLIFLEANLGTPGMPPTTITVAMLRDLFKKFPDVHIHFFSAGTVVEGIDTLIASLTSEEKSHVSSGIGESNFGTGTVPDHLRSPAPRRSSTVGVGSRTEHTSPGGAAADKYAVSDTPAPAPTMAAMASPAGPLFYKRVTQDTARNILSTKVPAAASTVPVKSAPVEVAPLPTWRCWKSSRRVAPMAEPVAPETSAVKIK